MSGWKGGLEPGKLKLNLMTRLKKEVLKQANCYPRISDLHLELLFQFLNMKSS